MKDLRDWLMEADIISRDLFGLPATELNGGELPGFDVLAEDPESWVIAKGEKYGLQEREPVEHPDDMHCNRFNPYW
jgi:hypothetical protein